MKAVEHTNGASSVIVVPRGFKPGDCATVERCVTLGCMVCRALESELRCQIGMRQKARSEALGG